jgi:hypothetical protein
MAGSLHQYLASKQPKDELSDMEGKLTAHSV